MRRSIEIRRGSRAWRIEIAPDLRIPAQFWGVYGRETFAEAMALHHEVVAAGRALHEERRKRRERAASVQGGDR